MTKSAQYGQTTNGQISMELRDDRFSTIIEDVEDHIRRLNGSEVFSYSIWKLPPSASLDDVDLKSWPTEYIQVAGSQDGMMAEIRRETGNGPVQLAIGYQDVPDSSSRTIHWDGIKTVVPANECLLVEDVVELFHGYLETGDVAGGRFILRELSIG